MTTLLPLLSLLAGCFPREAIARRAEVEADRYDLSAAVAVTTEGLDLAPFTWRLDAQIDWSYARTFRDGSMGYLLHVHDSHATIAREGAPDAPVGAPLDGVWMEVRAFPDGEVLSVTGASAWVGDGRHLEALDLLAPIVAPRLPSKRDDAQRFVTSWPVWVAGGPRVRVRQEAGWTVEGARWSYAGGVTEEGGPVSGFGEAHGDVTIGEGAVRVGSHRFDGSRSVTTRWPAGRVTQGWHVTGELRHAGSVPAPRLAVPVAADDPAADASPLRLVDGPTVADAPVDVAETAPFLFLPDDLPRNERARLRTSLAAAGSMSGEGPP